jgi:hypothetical protein
MNMPFTFFGTISLFARKTVYRLADCIAARRYSARPSTRATKVAGGKMPGFVGGMNT